jgi:formate-dependent nitrite reductase membrane component NrfD
MPTSYVIEPHWANWMVALEMFVAGLAAGTFFFMALAAIAGGKQDREVAGRLGFLPGPLVAIAGLLLLVDLGQPDRFMNLILTHPSAAERPGPLFMNPNSVMNYGTYILMIFGLFCVAPFFDAVRHTGRVAVPALAHTLSHNALYMGVGALFALGTAAYSGVLIGTTNQNVWSDTYILGGLYVAFSVLSGFAVAAIASDRLRATETAAAVRTGMLGTAVVAGVLLALLVGNLVALGSAQSLIATTTALVAPLFWIGAVGLAVLFPIAANSGARLRLAQVEVTSLAVVGTAVLVGVLAFRWSILHSALAAVGH